MLASMGVIILYPSVRGKCSTHRPFLISPIHSTAKTTMPNPWTGKGNPYTREEVRERLHATLRKGDAIIAAGAGTGISAKFIEKGGADLIIVYNSGRFRMMGHG